MNKVQLCECGCGHPVKLAVRNAPRYGSIRGKPNRFLYGHNRYCLGTDRTKSSTQRTHDRRLAQGLCQYCGLEAIDIRQTKGCDECKNILRERNIRYRAALRAEKRCACGRAISGRFVWCTACRLRSAERNRRTRAQQRRLASAAD